MAPELREHFKHLESLGWEEPTGFEWRSSLDAVIEIKSDIGLMLDVPVYLDDQVQDASFFADLCVSEDEKVFYPIIRFSSFDQMVVILKDGIKDWPARARRGMLPDIEEFLNNKGYKVISVDCLEEQYSGNKIGFEGTWFTRFFDYL